MDPYANMGCVLKVNAKCDACKMKVMEVLGAICGTYTVTIDAERELADINGQVDPNALLYALARSGQHAEIVKIKLQHPASSMMRPSHYYNDYYNHGPRPYLYGCSHTHTSGPIHDPYWYERQLPVGTAPFYDPMTDNYPRRARKTPYYPLSGYPHNYHRLY